MSFNFSWPTFSRQFHADAARMLDAALNRGPKPKVIADDIKVEDIYMGTIPPELEILEIGELSSERLRGIFRLTYTGDAHLILSTKVQANPLTRPDTGVSSTSFEDVSSAFPSSSTSRGILFAARPLVVPMQLRLSSMRLKAIIVLVVSKQKGITLVFKNDPLESVDVSSTFDSVAVIQKYLQQEIEGQLREMFREDLPGIIHRLSQSWLSSRNRKQTSGQAASRAAVPTERSPELQHSFELPADTSIETSASRKTPSNASVYTSTKGKSAARRRKSDKATTALASPSSSPPQRSSAINTPKASKIRGKAANGKMITPISSPTKSKMTKDAFADTSFASSGSPGGVTHDMESYDPTYGLRPHEVRMTGNAENFKGFAMLSGRTTRGFGDFATLSSTPEKDKEQRKMPASASIPSMLDLTRDAGGHDEDFKGEDIEEVGEDVDALAADPFDEQSNHDDVDDLDEFSASAEEIDDPTIDEGSDQESSSESHNEDEDITIDESMPQIQTSLGFSSRLSHDRRSNNARSASGRRMRTVSSSSSSSSSKKLPLSNVEYETIPAVGGGMATRPRVYHIASRVQAPDVEEEDDLASAVQAMSSVAASSTARGPASSRAMTLRARRSYDNLEGVGIQAHDEEGRDYSTDESPSAAGHESLATLDPVEMDPASIAYRTQLYRQQYGGLYRPGYGRNSSTSSAGLSSGASSARRASHSPDEDFTMRRRGLTPASRASTAPTSSHLSMYDAQATSKTTSPFSSRNILAEHDGQNPSFDGRKQPATLSPSNSSNAMTVNASNHFMDLVNSNHTLSPFTRTLDTKGFAVRSHPVTPTTPSVASAATGSASGRSNQENSMQKRLDRLRMDDGEVNSTAAARNSTRSAFASSVRPSAATIGRRRTFKLASSKSAGHTPSTVPTTPVNEWDSASLAPSSTDQRQSQYSANDARSWRAPPPSSAAGSMKQERGSDFGQDPRRFLTPQQQRPKLSSSHSNNSYLPSKRRGSYDKRRYDAGSASASLMGGESEYSGGIRTMNSIRE